MSLLANEHPHSGSQEAHLGENDGGNNESHSSPSSPTEDDGFDNKKPGDMEKKTGRRKINIEFIEDKSRRHITFSKRKAGIMKKAYELSTLTGTQVLLLVASETGHVYTFATPKLQPLITKPEGKNLIQSCLNAPEVPAVQAQQHHQSRLQGYTEPPNMFPTTDNRELPLDNVYDEDKKDAKGAYPPIGIESYQQATPYQPSNLVSSYMANPMVGSGLQRGGGGSGYMASPQGYQQQSHSQGYPASPVPVPQYPSQSYNNQYPMHSLPNWNKGMQGMPMGGMAQGQGSQGQSGNMSGLMQASKQSDHSNDHT